MSARTIGQRLVSPSVATSRNTASMVIGATHFARMKRPVSRMLETHDLKQVWVFAVHRERLTLSRRLRRRDLVERRKELLD